MARTIPLGLLVTRVRERSGTQDSQEIGDLDIKGHLSSVYAELYSIIVSAGLRNYESVQSIDSGTLVDNGDNSAYVALPTDYMGTIGVDYKNDQWWDELGELMAQDRNLFTGVGPDRAYGYSIIGSNLRFFPKPPAGQTYRHLYVPSPTDLSFASETSLVDCGVPGGEDFLIWGAARLAYMKTGNVAAFTSTGKQPSFIMDNFMRAFQRLHEDIQLRSINSARKVRVTDDFHYRDPADWPFSRR